MTPQSDAASTARDARAERRWLIGVGITVLFGIFGAVMAILAYTSSTSSTSSSGTRTPAGSAAPAPTGSTVPAAPASETDSETPGGGKGHGRK